jgi:hypothetical protein
MDLLGQTGIDLYEGKGKDAFERVAKARGGLEDAGLARVDLNRITLLDVSCRAGLAAAKSCDANDRRPFLDAVRRDAASLDREPAPWARALGSMARAGISSLEGKADARAMATKAVAHLRAAKVDVYAAACAHAADLEDDVRALMRREHVKNPDRFAQVFFPGRSS